MPEEVDRKRHEDERFQRDANVAPSSEDWVRERDQPNRGDLQSRIEPTNQNQAGLDKNVDRREPAREPGRRRHCRPTVWADEQRHTRKGAGQTRDTRRHTEQEPRIKWEERDRSPAFSNIGSKA